MKKVQKRYFFKILYRGYSEHNSNPQERIKSQLEVLEADKKSSQIKLKEHKEGKKIPNINFFLEIEKLFEQNEDLLKHQFNSKTSLEDKFSILLAHKDQISIETADLEKLMEDPRNSEIYIKPNEQGYQGIEMLSNNNIRAGDNPTALKILREGKIDISDKNIKFDSVNFLETGLLNPEEAKDLKQADAGTIEILDKNSISLKDIDIDNIPENEDIIIEPLQKQMILLGKKVKLGEDQIGNDLSVQEVSKSMFEETGEQEFQRKYTYFFDFYNKEQKFSQKLRNWLFRLPFFVFLYFLIDTSLEYFEAVNKSHLFERQEMSKLNQVLQEREVYAIEKLNKEMMAS